MPDLTYKTATLTEQTVPAHYTSVLRWSGTLGIVELDVDQDAASGVYAAHVALRVNVLGKQRSTAPGVAEDTDHVAAFNAAVQNYLDRCDSPAEERSPRELLMGTAQCAAVEAISNIPLAAGRVR
ncbi:MAG TPA: hypothetical protein VFR23_24630 [Jiangellaceae bacterium]|nr:hypothetical protein [Jiangellaceae bacterium]